MQAMIQRILVPTDFSAQADEAVSYAAALALPLWASVHLVHVVEEPLITSGGWDAFVPDTPEVRVRIRQECQEKLTAIAAIFQDRCARVTTEVRSGSAIDQITRAAVDYGANLIVMGTHGRSGLSHLLYGSVAEALIRTARCPVLAVRHGKPIAPAELELRHQFV